MKKILNRKSSTFKIMIILAIVLLVLVVLFLFYWKFYFLRNPVREPPKDGIVSPADGKITDIFEYDNNIEFKKNIGKINIMTEDVAEQGYIIAIFMSPFDVHYQKAPIDGKVIGTSYSKGKFKLGIKIGKVIENENNEILIKNDELKVKVVQIAGFFARRINCYVKRGDNIKKGQTIGLINFGSHVILVLPKNVKILVKEGDKVVGGVTKIAEI